MFYYIMYRKKKVNDPPWNNTLLFYSIEVISIQVYMALCSRNLLVEINP